MTLRSSSPEPHVSIANAAIIYGFLPIALLYLSSFVDWTNPVLQRVGVFVPQHPKPPIVVQTRNGEPLEVKSSPKLLSGEKSERMDINDIVMNEEAPKTKHENKQKVEQARNAGRHDTQKRHKEEKAKQRTQQRHDRRHEYAQDDRLSVVKSLDGKINALGIDFQVSQSEIVL